MTRWSEQHPPLTHHGVRTTFFQDRFGRRRTQGFRVSVVVPRPSDVTDDEWEKHASNDEDETSEGSGDDEDETSEAAGEGGAASDDDDEP